MDIPSKLTKSKKIYKWVDDELVNNCHICNKEFSVYYRKHHCRVCGRIFCYECSSNFIDVPESMQINSISKEKSFNVGSPSDSYMLNIHKQEKMINVRVCDGCNKKINETNNIKVFIDIFCLIDLTIDDYNNMKNVCKSWYQIASYFLDKLYNLQYTIVNKSIDKIDKILLWNNRKVLIGHNIYMTQLIKSVDIDNNKLNEVLKLIRHMNKSKTCKELKCSNNCNIQLSGEDYIILINSKIINIRKFAVLNLMKLSINELICYLPYLTHHMKYEGIVNSIIGDALIKKSLDLINNLEGYQFVNELYWQLNNGIDDNIYSDIYKYYLDTMNTKLDLRYIIKCHKFVSIIQNIPKKMLIDDIKDIFIQIIGSFPLPTNIEYTSLFIDIPNIVKKTSATEPLIIPLKNNTKTYKILYKSEDIRKDQIIMNIIKLIDIILKKELGMDFQIVTYNIRPTSNNSGFIEVIPDCETIYHIKEQLHFSILNFIIENNKTEAIHSIRQRFMKSCAAYCVITYLFGIGDRHLENIMITNKGKLFHIDYGYIMGYDAKPLSTPSMRLTSDMVDALGGINSKYYIEFKEMCNTILHCLRGHVNLFINMLLLLAEIEPKIDNGRFTKENIMDEILKRFMLGEDKEAELHLYNTIDNSSKDYKFMISDFFHYQNKENTVSSTIYNTYSGAKNLVSGWFSK